ncbi:hypothetical protein KPP03845_105623 [Streptomyces xanthophaeus]|uniref:hypothetical protein n=1 Tax=Streptomyces xanthophaeus TaxID=67385 RepID=UPI00233EC508|nr:hypothetical protein [Streptomyces xanthophaeus]WCD89204.1 hypothetical protein KPP03845_105623 [Streptomyces xanthophaeus]
MARVLDETYHRMNELATAGRYPFPTGSDGQPLRGGLQGPEDMRRMRIRIRRAGVRVLDHSPVTELLTDADGAVAGAAGYARALGSGRAAHRTVTGAGGAGLRPTGAAGGAADHRDAVALVQAQVLPYDKNYPRHGRVPADSLCVLDGAWAALRAGGGGGVIALVSAQRRISPQAYGLEVPPATRAWRCARRTCSSAAPTGYRCWSGRRTSRPASCARPTARWTRCPCPR